MKTQIKTIIVAAWLLFSVSTLHAWQPTLGTDESATISADSTTTAADEAEPATSSNGAGGFGGGGQGGDGIIGFGGVPSGGFRQVSSNGLMIT